MALAYKSKYSQYPDYSKFQFLDTTGAYNSTTNVGGFGTPNPLVNEVLIMSMAITKPDTTTFLPSTNPLDIYTKDVHFGSVGGVLPNLTGVLQDVTALELGYTNGKLVPGIYYVNIQGSGTSIEAGDFTFNQQYYIYSDGSIDCCLTKMLLSGKITDCCGCGGDNPVKSAMVGKMYLKAAGFAFKAQSYNKAAEFLIQAQEVCDGCIPCKAGC